MFGGILHLLKIPFRGLFIGSAAVIYISLIAQVSKSKSAILKATTTVVLVKAFVSPYTPLTAYLAVVVQGFLGYVLFSIKGLKKIMAPLFGLLATTLSGLQKIIILTLLFGNTLWKSIDEFVLFVLREFNLSNELPASVSVVFIGLYVFIHSAAGFYAGILSLNIPGYITAGRLTAGLNMRYDSGAEIFNRRKSKTKKRWWNRTSGLAIILFGIILVVLSFVFPQLGKNKALEIFIMFLRSIAITLIWFYLISPLILKWFKSFLAKKQSGYSNEINAVVGLFPSFKNITAFVYENTKDMRGLKRIKKFFSMWFLLMLSAEPEEK